MSVIYWFSNVTICNNLSGSDKGTTETCIKYIIQSGYEDKRCIYKLDCEIGFSCIKEKRIGATHKLHMPE